MDGVSSDVALKHVPGQVEMDRIPRNDGALTHIVELYVGDSGYGSSQFTTIEHSMSSVPCLFGITRSSNDYIPG